MWFNGTEISNKAQRALRNENVIIVAHHTGYVHWLYKDATIDKTSYEEFRKKLDTYLSTELSLPLFANFLRSNREEQKFFQVCRQCHGQAQFIRAEVLFHYEHGSNYRIADKTFDKLLSEVADEDFVRYELPNRIRCDRLDEFITTHKSDLRNANDRSALKNFLEPVIPHAEQFVARLADFIYTKASLPELNKIFSSPDPIEVSVEHDREQIIGYLHQKRRSNVTADLAFYAYRNMESCDWEPFIKAAVERNPVSIRMVDTLTLEQVYQWLDRMENRSIYDAGRLAQPDEVANFKRGDGLEKAFLLANVIRERNPSQDIEIIANKNDIVLTAEGDYRFTSDKTFEKEIPIPPTGTFPKTE